MRCEEYSSWLQHYVTDAVIKNYIKRCQRVEDNLHINLDNEYLIDNGVSLLDKLTYSLEDQLNKRPLKCNIDFNSSSNIHNGMGSLKTAVKKYFEFCKIDENPITNESSIMKDEQKQTDLKIKQIDSYKEFLDYFCINKEDFFDWGISKTIFPSVSKVAVEWDSLKEKLLNNQTVYIRGYGRNAHATKLYKELYKEIVNNYHIEMDPTNNAEPHKLIQRLTGLKRNKDIFNYQVSHIWGRTKNAFLFEAPWNICYTPKMMDPFTGHETQGNWPEEYQKKFITKAYELYEPFINEYNRLLIDLDISKRVEKYISSISSTVSNKEITQFSRDVVNELAPIVFRT